ncbi:helix-turn-helix domain-containing protein [Streptomyces sp. NPDC051162]|uniref:helix-turn-helix domain-containing protein n=1 Tax=Streptomyces sp. NPDC051162 TaxID=3154747 RepID=UPI0034203A7D
MTDGIREFAARLSELKERSGHSYSTLGKRLHMSTSTVHRYCNGAAVPTEYAPVERFARLCGASPEELVDLHRRWILADDARRRKAQGAGAGTPAEPDSTPEPARTPRPATPASAESADAVEAGDPEPTGPAGTASPDRTPAGTAHTPPPVAAEPDGPTEPARSTESAPPAAVAAGPTSTTDPEPAGPAAGPASPDRATARPAPTDEPRATAPATTPATAPARSTGGAPRSRRRLALIAAAVAVLVPTAVVAGYAATNSPPAHRAGTNATAAGPDADATHRASGRAPAPSGSPSPGGTAPSARPDASPSPDGGTTAAPREETEPDGERSAEPAGAPLSVDVRPYVLPDHCDQLYVSGRLPAQVPEPPAGDDARDWATALRAVPGGQIRIEVAVQGKTGEAVVLRALHVRVVKRAAPLAWNAYVMGDGCGSGIAPSHFDVDLDRGRPEARAVAGKQGDITIPATDFPYRTSSTDPQVLDVRAHTGDQDITWYLELEWSSGDRRGTLRVDDRGQPFRTSAVKTRPQYTYRYDTKAWDLLPDYSRR